MVRINASNISGVYFLTRPKLHAIIAGTLAAHRIHDAELSCVFTSDARIRAMNARYRGTRRPTDVLAFRTCEGRAVPGQAGYLGDIVISVERARAQAAQFGTTFKKEMCRYIIHGVLHLIGYDDEAPAPKRRMSRKEDELLERLCLSRV